MQTVHSFINYIIHTLLKNLGLNKVISIAFLVAFLISTLESFCQSGNIEFVENKGQWDNRIKFKGEINNGAFFLQEKGFRVLQYNSEDLKHYSDFFHGTEHAATVTKGAAARAVTPPKQNDSIILRSHTYDVKFLNAGTPAIVPDKAINTYNNYFIGNDPSKWQHNCSIYQAVTYTNLYPGIDVRYYTNSGKLKYDLIVHPGADLAPLAIKYDGVDGLSVKNEELVIKTSVGEMRELAPYAYQIVNGQKKEVGCRFKVSGNTVQFALDSYSKNSLLVIDPTLLFSTFTGSVADNWGYTATYGPDGSFYAGGIVFATGTFPTSPGAYQTTFQGGEKDEENLEEGWDIGIMKFSPNGNNRVYATYIGGAKNEQPHSLIVDAGGNLVIAGRSSSDNFPLKGGALVGPGGKYDIILTKLNATGSDLVGSRRIGGEGHDGVNIRPKYATPTGVESLRRNYGDDSRSEVIFDNSGNILLVSNTQSTNFPKTADAFQTTLSGRQDGVILKVSSDLSTILFSSLLGGEKDDAVFVLAINPNNSNVYIGGNTTSTALPGDKAGVLHTTFQAGETDGFVSILSPDATRLLKTTFIGTSGNDMLYGIQFDRFGYPYIMGTTTGNWPVLNAPFSQAGGKQFIAKLQPDLSAYVYSTIFGANSALPNISPIAFLVDRCENVYVSGWGGDINMTQGYPNAGTSGLSTTADAIQRNTDNSDFYFFVLARNATSQLFGSFFGQQGGSGEHVDGGTSRFDRNGVIYQALCANCGADVAFPTTPGVWSPSNPSKNCNLAAVKIAFNLAGVVGSVRSSIQGSVSDTTGCVPLTVNFSDTLAQGKRYVWNFGDNSPDVETLTPSLSHTYNAIGTYRVRLVSIDSAKCNVADTAYTSITVKTFKAFLDFNARKVNPCDSFKYEFTNTSFVTPAARAFSATSFRWDFGDGSPAVIAGTNNVLHNFPSDGTYNVTLALTDTNFCNAPTDTTKALRIASNVKAGIQTAQRGCAPYSALFNNVSAGGQQFFWDFGDGTNSTQVNPVHVYQSPGAYVVRLTAIDSGTCNVADSTTFNITVSAKPVAAFTFAPDPPEENTPTDFFNNSVGATDFKWYFGDGDSLLINSTAAVKHAYNETKTYTATLIALSTIGCPDTATASVSARVLPLLDVPNAFTPNGDGVNDKVFVRGYGIAKLKWRIYNRWGALIFESIDRNVGWDGTYKGTKQPSEVYHYVLDVEYFDNTRSQKKGDITLLR
jgi:gliding motility-associated-like protein